MPEPLHDDELERLMLETRERVDLLRSGNVPDEERPTVEGHGAVADDRARVTVRAGQVASIEFDPRLLRLPAEEFGALIRDAVNAAIDDLHDSASAGVPTPDLAAVGEALREMQNETLRQMAVFTQGIADAMAQIRERTSIGGDPTPHGLERLFELTQRNLDGALASVQDVDAVRGEGSAAKGSVRAVAAVGRVESVTVDPKAMRLASHELADHLRTAVNAAIDDLTKNAATAATPAGTTAEELRQRVQDVQDMSLEQFRSYTRALRDIMDSIGGPA